jgi:hypothetical protein
VCPGSAERGRLDLPAIDEGSAADLLANPRGIVDGEAELLYQRATLDAQAQHGGGEGVAGPERIDDFHGTARHLDRL